METNKSKQKITPFLWFEDRAEEALEFYASIFPNSRIDFLHRWPKGSDFPEGTVRTASITLDGFTLYAFDAPPMADFNTSISFFVTLETRDQVDAVWTELSKDGQVLMDLDSYSWSPRYGWVIDRFGISWQINMGKIGEVGQRVCPCLMYSGDHKGKAEEALEKHMSLFEGSSLVGISRYGAAQKGNEGLINHAQFELAGQTFMSMDNGMDDEVPFNESISLYVTCRDQGEVDHFWDGLIQGGGAEAQCGWLKDPYGTLWQIVPDFLDEKIVQGDPQKVEQMMQAVYKMKKINVAQLKASYNQ